MWEELNTDTMDTSIHHFYVMSWINLFFLQQNMFYCGELLCWQNWPQSPVTPFWFDFNNMFETYLLLQKYLIHKHTAYIW